MFMTRLIHNFSMKIRPKKKRFKPVQTRTELHENQITVWFGSGNGSVPVQLRRVIFQTSSVSSSQKNAPEPNQTEPWHHYLPRCHLLGSTSLLFTTVSR